MKILLAIDDSRFSEAAVRSVAEQFRTDATVHVLHVLELTVVVPTVDTPPSQRPDLPRMRKDATDAARKLVERAAEQIRSAGFSVTTEVKEGEPKSYIVERAQEWGADVIVLGSHGKKGLQRFMMGSVSEAVARHAHCSVQIVRLKR